MTREGRQLRRAWLDFDTAASNYERLFAALFQSAIALDGIDEYIDKEIDGMGVSWVLRNLYITGGVALHKRLKLWLPYWADGRVNVCGEPKAVTLWGKDGTNFTVSRNEVALFNAFPSGLVLAPFMSKRAALIADFDNAIKQNLDGIKEASAIITDDKTLADSVRAADKARRDGASIITLNRDEAALSDLTVFKTGAAYHCTELINDRRSLYIDCMHIVGVRTPLEKTERLITDEQFAQNAEADAYIATVVKYFNEQAERQGIAINARFMPLREVDYIGGAYAPAPEDDIVRTNALRSGQ